jgi:radical SAM family uncharacterized protein
MKKPVSTVHKSTDREVGAIRKPWRTGIRIALVYPNRYAVGMSNLGFQSVYALFNSMEDVLCERAFFPDNRDTDVRTVESCRPLTDFHIIAFSISFENDFPNVLRILRLSSMPVSSENRDNRLPLVMAGGVACFLNPEPLAPFIDLFVIGEAESVLRQFIEQFDPGKNRFYLLKQLATSLEGIYVPTFYRPIYADNGTFQKIAVRSDVPDKIKRVYCEDLSGFSTCTSVLTADTAFEHAHLIEISRGCPHGCRFCSAGFVYRPFRYRPESFLKKTIEKASAITDRIGLVGAAISDYPDIDQLCNLTDNSGIRLSFSSIRADNLNEALLEALKTNQTKTVAIAPDAGSQRLRNVINKGLSEDAILDAVETVVTKSIPNLKLYFMIGLPTETHQDVKDIVSLCKRIKHVFLRASRLKGKMGMITVSLNCFVPKPFTPFQWVGMDAIRSLKQKIKQVKQGLKGVANLKVHADIPRWAYLQGLFSRGDRRVSKLIASLDENNQNLARTFKESHINSDFYVLRQRYETETFPWDIIDQGIKKTYLWDEYQRALQEKPTPPCPEEQCHRCGICG